MQGIKFADMPHGIAAISKACLGWQGGHAGTMLSITGGRCLSRAGFRLPSSSATTRATSGVRTQRGPQVTMKAREKKRGHSKSLMKCWMLD